MGKKPKVISNKGDWDKVVRRAEALDGKVLEVGFPAEKVSDEIIQRAAYNEFGTPTAPERPFLRPTFDRFEKGWSLLVAAQIGTHLDGGPSLDLDALGLQVVDSIRRAIRAKSSPANAPSTVQRKGHDDVLRDTNEMHDSVDYVVKDKG